MGKRCEVCGKREVRGNRVSHSNHKTKRSFLPNVHRVRARVGEEVVRLMVCTRCLRSGRVKRAVS